MKEYKKNYLIKLCIFVGLLIVDQVSKFLLVYCDIPLINGIIKFEYTENTGAGFGILNGKLALLIIMACVFLIAIFIFDYFNKNKKGCYLVGISLVFAGAVGNLLDRFIFGYVRDFVKLEFINFPIFNVADICLTVGVILLLIDILFVKEKKNA